jgi:mercuric ion binding protein
MKKELLVFSLLMSFLTGCKNEPREKIVTVSANATVQNTTPEAIKEKAYAKLSIDGMTCAIGCAATIQKNLNQTAGVASATVDFESHTAWVIYDAKAMGLKEIREVVEATGEAYRVTSAEQLEDLNP